MNSAAWVAVAAAFLAAVAAPQALAQVVVEEEWEDGSLEAFTNSRVYTDGQPLFVYGTALPGENLIVRMFSPDGTILKFDQIATDGGDGSFNHRLLIWPEPSASSPYGTYLVEVISTEQRGLSLPLDVKFSSTDDLIDVPVKRSVETMVFAPETAGVNATLRLFAQVTSDGSLIAGDPDELLASTHVHLPGGSVVPLSESFRTLHQGLYYADYVPERLGTYVFHVVTFHQGTASHGSAATNVLLQDVGGISEHIQRLNSVLDDTSAELETLKDEVSEFGAHLEVANRDVDTSVSTITASVGNIEEASSQLNSLLFPVVGAICIVAALQIVILARSR